MPKTPFVSIESIDGIVKNVEGTISTGGIFGGALELVGQKVTDVLNKCAAAGYEHFDTDIIDNKKIYRLKLRL